MIDKKGSELYTWTFSSKLKEMPFGKILRIHCLVTATVRWTTDDWFTYTELMTLDSGVGVHYVDLPTADLPHTAKLSFTFYWHEAEVWENINYDLSVENKKAHMQLLEGEDQRNRRDKVKVFLPS